MIWKWIEDIKHGSHGSKCFVHLFRRLLCKEVEVEGHGIPICKVKQCTCDYRWCPKVNKEGNTE